VTEWYPGEQKKKAKSARRRESGREKEKRIKSWGVSTYLDAGLGQTDLHRQLLSVMKLLIGSAAINQKIRELIRVTLRHHFSGIISYHHARRAADGRQASNLKIN
jgi:hypothetical protein